MFVLAAACEACSHTQSQIHKQTYTHKQTVLGGGATSMTTNQLKVLRPKSFACLRLSCDQTQSQIPTGPKKQQKQRTSHSFPSLPLSLSLSPLYRSSLPPSGDFCRLAKVSWLINVPAAVWLFHVRHAHYLPPISIELKQQPRPLTPLSTI